MPEQLNFIATLKSRHLANKFYIKKLDRYSWSINYGVLVHEISEIIVGSRYVEHKDILGLIYVTLSSKCYGELNKVFTPKMTTPYLRQLTTTCRKSFTDADETDDSSKDGENGRRD